MLDQLVVVVYVVDGGFLEFGVAVGLVLEAVDGLDDGVGGGIEAGHGGEGVGVHVGEALGVWGGWLEKFDLRVWVWLLRRLGWRESCGKRNDTRVYIVHEDQHFLVASPSGNRTHWIGCYVNVGVVVSCSTLRYTAPFILERRQSLQTPPVFDNEACAEQTLSATAVVVGSKFGLYDILNCSRLYSVYSSRIRFFCEPVTGISVSRDSQYWAAQ